MKNLIFILVAMLLFACSDDEKDYGLPPEVPEDVQAGDFQALREDFAIFYNAYYNKNVQGGDIQINEVNYYGFEHGYALLFSAQLGGQIIQFCACYMEAGTVLSTGSDGISVIEQLPFGMDFKFYMPRSEDGRLSCQVRGDGSFQITSVGGEFDGLAVGFKGRISVG